MSVTDFDQEPRDTASLPAEVLGDLLHAAAIAHERLRNLAGHVAFDEPALSTAQIAHRLDHALHAVHDQIEVVERVRHQTRPAVDTVTTTPPDAVTIAGDRIAAQPDRRAFLSRLLGRAH